MSTDVETYEPTEEEVQAALARLRKQKEYRKQYQVKRAEKLETDPALAEKDAAKRKEYFEKHKDEIYSKRKTYYEKNKEKIKAYHKKYHDKQNAVMKALRAKAKEANMNLETYLETIA